jgi:hypothetical protein
MRRYGNGPLESSTIYKKETLDINKALTVARLYEESNIFPTVENVLHIKDLRHLECFKASDLLNLAGKLHRQFGKKEVDCDGFIVENVGSMIKVTRREVI